MRVKHGALLPTRRRSGSCQNDAQSRKATSGLDRISTFRDISSEQFHSNTTSSALPGLDASILYYHSLRWSLHPLQLTPLVSVDCIGTWRDKYRTSRQPSLCPNLLFLRHRLNYLETKVWVRIVNQFPSSCLVYPERWAEFAPVHPRVGTFGLDSTVRRFATLYPAT